MENPLADDVNKVFAPAVDFASAPAPAAANAAAPQSSIRERRRIKLTKTLPTDRMGFNKQLEVIIAIPVAFEKAGGTPIAFTAVAAVMGLAEATLLQASAFFGDVGIIQRVEGGKFVPSTELQDFYRMHGISPDKAWLKLAPLFERSWFGQELIPRLKLRGTMDEAEAKEVLAETANAEKAHLDQLRIAIDYLQKAGVIMRDGSQIRLATTVISQDPPPPPASGGTPGVITNPATPQVDDPTLEQHSITLDAPTRRKVIIHTPPNVTRRELQRIQKWLEFQLIVEDDDGNDADPIL